MLPLNGGEKNPVGNSEKGKKVFPLNGGEKNSGGNSG